MRRLAQTSRGHLQTSANIPRSIRYLQWTELAPPLDVASAMGAEFGSFDSKRTVRAKSVALEKNHGLF